MKIRVISEFYDKFHTATLFKVGTVLDFDDERANDVIAKKLAEPFEEPAKKEEDAPVVESAPAAEPEMPAEQPLFNEQQAETEEAPAHKAVNTEEEPADAEPEKKRVGRHPKVKVEETEQKEDNENGQKAEE